MIKYFLSITLLLCLFVSCKQIDKSSVKGLITEHAMVVSARAEASKIGSAILKKGGNAFDAMCATQLALAVAYPFAGNIGGGGFMVYRKANGDIGSIDFREKAPLAATKNMYLDELGEVIPNKSILGAMAVGVPGTIAGVFEVHKKLGSLPIEDILEPVINLAYKGVTVTKKQEQKIKKYQPLFLEANKQPIILDTLWKTNDVIKYPELAKTLERILKHGRDEFYKGETAKILAKFIQDNGGIITEEDLSSIGYRLKCQLNENSKMLSYNVTLPEMNHNELVAWSGGDARFAPVFFNTGDLHPRNQKRLEITLAAVEKKCGKVFTLHTKGATLIERSLYLIHIVDWASYYLSELKPVDAMDIKVIDYLKSELAKF